MDRRISLIAISSPHRVLLCLFLTILTLSFQRSTPLSLPPSTQRSTTVTRAGFFRETALATLGVATFPSKCRAEGQPKQKLLKLSDEELKKIVTADLVERSFLVSADITREIYDEGSSFTDEIDSYTMDKWIKGTKKLFVAEGSRVDLVGDVSVSPESVEFRFDEDLMFRIPFRPVVSLTGKVVLTRDPHSGLITSYREFWDQDVNSVLKTAKF